PIMVKPKAVMHMLWPIVADSDPYIVIGEEIYPFIGYKHPVGLHTEIGAYRWPQALPYNLQPVMQVWHAGQHRLAAVQDNVQGLPAVRFRVGSDTFSHPGSNLQTHFPRLVPVSLILEIVHVAITAIQVTAADDFYDESRKGNRSLIHVFTSLRL